MSRLDNIGCFYLGATWFVTGTAKTAAGAAIDLSGATVRMWIETSAGLSVPLDATVTNAAAGEFSIVSDPDIRPAIPAGVYRYQTWCDLADGSEIAALRGTITVLPEIPRGEP